VFILIFALIISIISSYLKEGHFTDAYVIGAVIIINALLGFSQEYKAEKSMEALKKLATPKAKVIRNGLSTEIKASEIVPGDIILLEEGDRIPADARLIEIINLKVDESMLTGESIPVMKQTKEIRAKTVADQKNMVFAGTIISYGRGKAVVTSTGFETEMGKIARMIGSEEKEITPLQKKLNHFGKILGLIVIVLTAFIFILGMFRPNFDMFDMMLTAIALAVSAVPEGMPAVVTITLAIGMRRLAKENALIRKLSAVETLGSTTVICADKTGTMTTNEMTVKNIFLNNRMIGVTGIGFEPKGEFIRIDPYDKHLQLFLRTALLCNNSVLRKVGEGWEVVGDSTEAALVVMAAKGGLWKENIECKKVLEIPFSSERKMMSVVYDNEVYVKGAPEKILVLSNYIYENNRIRKITKSDKERISTNIHKMAKGGLRVLGLAYKKVDGADRKDIEKNLVFIGLAGMIDPPRKEVKDAIALCKYAGIKVVMITGDHKVTAEVVAKKVGLEARKIISGAELDRMSDDELLNLIEDISIYARVSPEHKLRIIKAFKKKNHLVAMTGDGVNDAPALKDADIGVAMGIKGTDVAREASDMVLTDDNFSSIVKAVEEGRCIYDNIKKFVRFLLAANFDEIFVILIAISVGLPFLPLLPIHILWINLITDGLPALSLSMDPKEPDLMKRKPRSKDEHILSKMMIFIITAGAVACLMTITVFSWELIAGANLDMDYLRKKAQTMAFTTAIMFELFFIFNCRSEKHSILKTNPLSNRFLIMAVFISIVMQLLVIYLPPLQSLFGTVPLGLIDWLKIILFSSSALLLSPKFFLV